MISKIAITVILILILLLTACKAPAAEKASEQQAVMQENITPGTIVQQTTGQIKFKVIPPENGSSVSI